MQIFYGRKKKDSLAAEVVAGATEGLQTPFLLPVIGTLWTSTLLSAGIHDTHGLPWLCQTSDQGEEFEERMEVEGESNLTVELRSGYQNIRSLVPHPPYMPHPPR